MPANLTFKRDFFCLDDQLGFDRYVLTLAEMITDKHFRTPFCIGIHGDWGSGKTSFMRQLEEQLKKRTTEVMAVPVWFNPWRYGKEEHLIIPFLRTIAAALKGYEGSEEPTLKDILAKAAEQISKAARAIAYGATFKFSVLALSGKDMIDREAKLGKDDIAALTDGLPDIYYGIIDHLQKAVQDQGFRLVVFVDDLDRCLPEKVVELLEAIKLFLDLEGYLFILGVNRLVVEEGIRRHYAYSGNEADAGDQGGKAGTLAEKYLEKMIQMPLELPPIEPSRKRKLILSLLENSTLSEYSHLIEYGIAGRPRDIIRFVNFLAFFCRLAEKLKHDLALEPENSGRPGNWQELVKRYFSPEFYVKWAILAFAFREDHRLIIGVTSHFFLLQQAARRGKDGRSQDDEKNEAPAVNLREGLRRVLVEGTAFAEEPWLIRKYVHLADAVGQVTAAERMVFSPAGLQAGMNVKGHPAIGAMARVSRGPFLYGDDKKPANIEEDFEIDVYPVTNRQFADFLNECFPGGQEPKTWGGKQIIYQEQSRLSRNTPSQTAAPWSIEEGYDDHPVTGVTWFGAVDFCRWRTEKEGTIAAPFRLPAEIEWEKAARGDGGNEYPWGNEFDPSKCNTEESGRKGTSRVTDYPEGKSPYGCYDMAGNVWEWTGSAYDDDSKVIRGGSWFGGRAAARCACRDGDDPDDGDDNIGFRCARTIKMN